MLQKPGAEAILKESFSALCLTAALLLAGCVQQDEADLSRGPRRGATEKPSPQTSPREARSQGSPEVLFPGPNAPLPKTPKAVAEELVRVNRALKAAIDRWLEDGGALRAASSRPVARGALRQQKLYRALVVDPDLTDAVLRRVGPAVRSIIKDHVIAGRGLRSLVTPVEKAGDLPVTPPDDPRLLRRLYHRAAKRFGLEWEVLAALNFVESKFGRFMGPSSAGAMGPMQFIPSTWDAYGGGGNILDPRDAIPAAASYLAASGAPADMRGALFAYNRSYDYVDAIQAYARHIERDPRNFYAYYFWQVFVITTGGDVQLSGPGTGTR